MKVNFLGLLFYFIVGLGLLFLIPPWFLYCLLFNKKQKFTLICKPFFNVVFFLFGIKVLVEGSLPEQGKACFILCNHQSFIDVPVMLCKIFPCAFLAKESLFKIPYFGQFLTYTNSIPIERGNKSGNTGLPEKIQKRLSRNFPIGAFPEGTRSEKGELLPFKNGIFRIIKEVNAPVFPVTIVGAHKVMPKKSIAIHPGKIKIIPHNIITAEEVAKLTYEELKDRVRGSIGKLLHQDSNLEPTG